MRGSEQRLAEITVDTMLDIFGIYASTKRQRRDAYV